MFTQPGFRIGCLVIGSGGQGSMQKELYRLFSSDPDAARQRMVEMLHIGVALKIEEVRGVLRGMMDDEDESTTSSLMRLLLVQLLAGISAATRGAE